MRLGGRVLQTELNALDVDQKALAKVSEAFGKARLLLFDRDPLTRQPTVEVVHEALITRWERLRRWLDRSRADLQMQKVLAHSTAEWQGAKEDESYLLRGKRLDQFEGWIAATDLALTDGERIFLEASLAQRNRHRAAEAAQLAREKALERRSRRFLGALAAVLAIATVIALALSIYAFGQRRNALKAYSMSLTANARQSLDDGDSATALALAMVANQINDPAARSATHLAGCSFRAGRSLLNMILPNCFQASRVRLPVWISARTEIPCYSDSEMAISFGGIGNPTRKLNVLQAIKVQLTPSLSPQMAEAPCLVARMDR